MSTPSRRERAAVAVIIALAALPCAAQSPAPPTTAKDVLLTAQTPLGAAAIVRPAGSEVTEPVAADGEIVLREGPFTARIDREDLVFPAPPTAASPAMVTDAATERQKMAAAPTEHVRWQEDWRVLIPTGAAMLLGIYSLIITVAFFRRHRAAEY